MPKKDHYDLVIVGTGAAGLAAALYAGRYAMSVLVVGDEFGGETARAGIIWNYPGNKGIDGYELMKVMKVQAEEVGSEVFDGKVEKISNEGGCFSVFISGSKTVTANTIIFAGGTKRKRLGLPNEKELTSRGVHYCVTCDGPLYTGKTIIVVGGGDAAVKGINLVATYAKKIYVLVRGDSLRAEPANLEELKKLGDKVEILYQTEVKEIIGKEKFEKISLTKPFKENESLVADGLFVEIGAEPDMTLSKLVGAQVDEYGYVKTDSMMQTNVPGFYAAGDTVNIFGSFKQDITAAATGAVAATSAYNYKKIHGDLCQIHHIPTKLEKTASHA